jgi:hexosaminidase
MLDEARNFKGKKVVKEILDQMALLKMNVFHWHLTDDQGWRIEIKKFPLLTEVGAFRDSTRLRKMVWRDERWHWVDSEVYSDRANGGYYTQEDIRELVAYASARHITVIPEIEMPGHATAAIAAYPWLMYPPKQVKVPSSLGIKKLAYNVADEKVIGFLQDVILEVMELFPGKILHIGGDEVKYDTWKDNSAIKKLMEKEKLKNYADVQIHFTNQISTFIEKNGFRMMGWNEILGNVHVEEGEKSAQLELSKKSIINFWKGDSLLFIDALTKGYDVVNARSIYTYLDFPGKRTPISVAYNFSPAPRGITNEQRKHVLGFGCYMWGETSPTVRLMQGYTFPRIAAYAEAGWTRDINKDFVRFSSALVRMKEYWDKKGIYYKEE